MQHLDMAKCIQQVQSGGGKNLFSQPRGCVPAHQGSMLVSLSCQAMMGTHAQQPVQLLQTPLTCCSQPVPPQYHCKGLILPAAALHSILAEFTEVPIGPFLQPAWAVLNGSPDLEGLKWSPQFHVEHRDESTLFSSS